VIAVLGRLSLNYQQEVDGIEVFNHEINVMMVKIAAYR
jgi:hypothetical protein